MDWMLQKKEREKLWLNTYLLQQNTDTVAVKQVVKELGWSRYLVQSNGIDLVRDLQAALMLDLRTDFSLPCKLIAEEHFLYDSIFTRI
ncbi:hypothetical protein FO436_03590 [Weissella cibaria]|uniref:hypothetical protein n=1 Tax=Weissella cibaria TaxID=137591 RepID=UPI001190E844|nr:hypothetical protein [Weissella cibaria]TVV33731.1 hypothetical protein FO436_03590 [Weissella cibaria]